MEAAFKLQVACPAYSLSGGPEALHQLVHIARGLGVDARIVYLNVDHRSAAPPTAEAFKVYDVRVDSEIDDRPGVLLVVPETETQWLARCRHLTKAIWWLSVDNFHVAVDIQRRQHRHWWKRRPRPFDLAQPEPGVLHLAQSAYARDFLTARGLQPVFMLTDYLRDDFLEQARRSSTAPRLANRIAYNPKKGLQTTQQIEQRAAGAFEFVRIENMTPTQVIELLRSSAVYMDFGHHPGRDRIPREAVACGCKVLTGRLGAAANAIDIPIPDAFKLDVSAPGLADTAVAALHRLASSAADVAQAFEPYRATILGQKQTFADEVGAFVAHARAMPRSTGSRR
jgi:hypothetical protein